MTALAAVILAAGRGDRLGGAAKALLSAGGETFLARIAARCREAGCGDAVVVVGEPFAGEVGAAARELGLAVAINPDPDRGMASSVAVGFAHLDRELAGLDAALLWPVDHPRVSAGALSALVARAAPDRVVIPTYEGRGGHPALVGRDLFPELAGCAGLEGGARAVFRREPGRAVRVPVEDPGVVRDVDHPADLEAVR